MLISATFTPFKKDFSLDLDLIETLHKNFTQQGLAGTMIAGTTGEGYSMSVSERKLLLEAWKDCVDNDFKLYVHVGHNSIPDIWELSQHAVDHGVEALVLSAPTFFKPAEIEDLVLFLKEATIQQPEIKLYYYHIPSLTGVGFPMIDFLGVAENHQLKLTGIKYTHDDLADFEKCIHFQKGKYDMMFGQDENLLAALEKGATVALGSTYNYMAGLFYQIIKEYKTGRQDAALDMQNEARRIIDILIKYGGGVIGGKAFMNLTGIDCGPVRLPLRTLDKGQLKQLRAELKKTKFFEYSNLIQSKSMKI